MLRGDYITNKNVRGVKYIILQCVINLKDKL